MRNKILSSKQNPVSFQHNIQEEMSHMHNPDEIQRVAKLTKEQRDANLRWLFKQDDEIQIEAMRQETEILRNEQRHGRRITEEIKLGSLAAAVEKLRKIEKGLHRKNREMPTKAEFDYADRIRKLISSSRKPRAGTKESKVIMNLETLKRLHYEDGFSYEKMAQYLKTNNHLRINKDTIRKTFRKLGLDDEYKKEER